MKAVIMAGGKGTRLIELTKNEIPKPMAPLNGKPILAHQIEKLKENNITEITIIIGHLGNKIVEFFGDGSNFNVNITYISEDEPLGTAGSLFYLNNLDEYFLLIFGDTLFDIDIHKMELYHNEKKSIATLFAHPNSHPFDSDLLVVDSDFKITKFDSKKNKRNYLYDNLVNAGFYILNTKFIKPTKAEKLDLEKDILTKLIIDNKNIFAYISTEYIKDIGTIERIDKASEELKKGIVAKKNLKNKQKCIFLDRDGTINKFNGLVCKTQDFILEDFASDAIKLINESGYLAIVITNQPVVARGLCTIQEVENIHKKMKMLLGEKHVFLDDIFFCPHHPDKGFPEENPKYKLHCNCRKPSIGMIEAAIEKHNIDISCSWFIGDTTTDIMTAKNANLKSVLVFTGQGGKDGKYDVKSTKSADNILEAVKKILN